MLRLRRQLNSLGVLGINRRNAEFVSLLNPRRLYPLVDDKLHTKRLALQAGMAVPELYGVIAAQHDIRRLPTVFGGNDRFVIKPAHGSGGNGILVITGRHGRLFRKSNGVLIDLDEIGHHVSNALSGLYSLGGQRDRAMIEYCVRFDPVFEEVSYQGVPDIRIIVYRGYPVMSMVRLPTRMSEGKANLHQGAIGVGIDLGTGTTLQGVWGSEIITEHPDTGHRIDGILVPAWQAILELAARCSDISGLGYLGVDIVLDRDLGPLILELNARPGLSIQLANREGLRPRLGEVERVAKSPEVDPQERVEFARRHFGRGG